MFNQLRQTYRDFSRAFWLVAFASFIDQIGNFILMPFIALYVTGRYDVGLTEVGIAFAIAGLGGLIGGIFGGALADKIGRKSMMLFGLLVSGIFNLSVIFINRVSTLYIVLMFANLLGALGGPARSAMVIDVLPVEKRTEGFGILRITMNVAATVGPLLGGLLADYNFNLIFIIDAILKTREVKKNESEWPAIERKMIVDAIIKTQGRLNRAATVLGWSRSKLYRKIHQHGIET